ncbi:hypothetical protein AOXY_G37139 [Acipenser oxyrinchus oxyrinchus]|uniref:Uncharacterized protein n=1 Tax=Acipenser oxyrinchus oxyrinchus TaxID=40147 RepID=A0AAD8CDZ0_ACIOX|nr:hypothetical protein AOXY_G37139 [Acipenser oxyrinchus oxyrinchus]
MCWGVLSCLELRERCLNLQIPLTIPEDCLILVKAKEQRWSLFTLNRRRFRNWYLSALNRRCLHWSLST